MEHESMVEKLLNEGLELLSNEEEKEQKKAFASLRAAFALGSMEAAYYEGLCYQRGIGIYKNAEQAYSRFEMAASEVPEAMYELGLCYINGTGTEQDIDKGFACFSSAAQSGVPEAMYELGVCYRYGEGTEQDINTAMYWYEKAAKQDCFMAWHNMGVVYQNGIGDEPVDYVKAFNCFSKATEGGSPDSFFCVGNCYLNVSIRRNAPFTH